MDDTVFVLAGPRSRNAGFAPLKPRILRSQADVSGAALPWRRALWICTGADGLAWMTRSLAGRFARRRGALLVLGPGSPVRPDEVSLLAGWFEHLVLTPGAVLSDREMAIVLARPDRAEFCLGGTVHPDAGMVVLVRGDLSVLAAPLADFPPSGDGTAPDFADFEVVDHGRTLRFGRYESALDAVLYLHDPAYRRKLRRHRAATDRTLGACLRRLRIQRGLRLDDFGGLARTVARIERGEVLRPREGSLQEIADRLGVRPDEIVQF